MTRQSTKDKPKTRCISHQSSPVCALRKLAGFADKSTSVAQPQTQTRNASGTEIGTRYRYIDDTPLVPFNEKGTGSLVVGSGSSSSATGANSTSTSTTAQTRSRPSNEYVLYSYGEPVAMTADGNASYFGTDILGSVRNVTDKYGAVQSNYNYDAFGSPYLSNLDNDMSFGYCGKIYDNGTGLYDYGFRDYSPNQARFTTIDPIRDGNNWFSYVVNDPVNYIDPFGLTSTDSGSGKPTNTNPANNNAPNEPNTGTNDSPSTPADTGTPTQPAPTAPAAEPPTPEASAPTVPTPSSSAPPVSTGNLSSPSGGGSSHSQNKNSKYNQLFANEISKYIGIPYEFGGNSDDGMDCTAPIHRALTAMGFSVDRNSSSGYATSVPYIKFYDNVDNDRRADLGVINFYAMESENTIDHVNYGIGITNTPTDIDNPKKQIIDATDKPSVAESQNGITYMSQRDGRISMGQYVTPVDGQINQTYSPYPSRTPVKQGYIDWDYLEQNCR